MPIKLKELPIEERPYEKLELYGPEKLTNSELLAIIIKTGTKEETAVQLAQRIINLSDDKDDLSFLHDIGISEFTKIKGIGKVKAIQLIAVVELAKRINKPMNSNNIKILKTPDVAKILMNELKNERDNYELNVGLQHAALDDIYDAGWKIAIDDNLYFSECLSL